MSAEGGGGSDGHVGSVPADGRWRTSPPITALMDAPLGLTFPALESWRAAFAFPLKRHVSVWDAAASATSEVPGGDSRRLSAAYASSTSRTRRGGGAWSLGSAH